MALRTRGQYFPLATIKKRHDENSQWRTESGVMEWAASREEVTDGGEERGGDDGGRAENESWSRRRSLKWRECKLLSLLAGSWW